MIEYSTFEAAREALIYWPGDASTLMHISDSGNSVYQFAHEGQPYILRLTDPAYRKPSVNQAELDFIDYLHQQGVQVSYPLPSVTGRFIEIVGARGWLASVLSYALGVEVQRHSPYWNEAFFKAWGRTLAQIHQAGVDFQPIGEARRWQWWEEDLIAQAEKYLPKDDVDARREYRELRGWLELLPTDTVVYGLTHADFAPANFRYSPENGLTAFDFGNACYQWFVYDVAISLSTLRSYPERNQYRDWIVAGYEMVYPLDRALWSQLDLWIRWRILYVYLDRLSRWADSPNPDHQQTLAILKQRVGEGFVW